MTGHAGLHLLIWLPKYEINSGYNLLYLYDKNLPEIRNSLVLEMLMSLLINFRVLSKVLLSIFDSH